MAKQKKLRIGWFSFTCCEDSTIVFTELLNDYWDEWTKVIDFYHVKILKSNNKLDNLDVAFIEGAISSLSQAKQVKKIRANAKQVVAIGSCAITSMPSAHRNEFPKQVQSEIDFLIKKFHYGQKVKKLAQVIKIDEQVPGCPMDEAKFLLIVNKMLKHFKIK
ncbi:hypothetical protein ISS06_01670 [Patescibacteria group bacterium]|nr:hypothetical protein [Patescibacteria group bacterium]